MSHWHRAPRAISVCSLIQRYAKYILLDRSVEIHVGDLKALSKDVQAIPTMDPGGSLSRAHVVRLCQEMHGLLITADIEVIPMLISDCGVPWGAILLLENKAAQTDAVKRLVANQLTVSPSVEQEIMVEYVRQNRLLVDLRGGAPSVGVFSNCRWSKAKA
jgi:hypothetical protein